jgi:IclR family acetate operon transcriptional repressor
MPVKTAKTVQDVIQALVELEEARFSELVDHLEMPRSTLNDHLRSLEALGLVVIDDNKYRASLRLLDIGERVRQQREAYRAGHEQIKQLARETGEHATLMIEENGYGVILDVARGENAVDLRVREGNHLELSTNAPGKMILARTSPDRIEEIIDQHGLPEYTPKTITDRSELEAELDEIREQGYATDTGELVEGVRAVAAPVSSRGQIRGAIAVGGPRKRMSGTRFEDEIPDMLLQASNVVELNLSYP